MKVTLPKFPKPGAQAALLAPASPLADQSDLDRCVANAEALGLQIKRYPTLTKRRDYMAGTEKERARDLMRAFTDDKIEAILCLRGGYSTCHVLPLLDWKVIKQSRKLFTGFSDLTSMLTPLAALSGLASLHAPTMGYFKENAPRKRSMEALQAFLFGPWGSTSYRELCGKDFQPNALRKGKAQGRLIGGNASVFAALAGTPYMPKRGPFILFLEDIGEKPYKLDRYVTQLIQSGFMEQVAGVALGQFTECDPTGGDTGKAEEVIARLLAPLKIPVLAGLPIGHDEPSYPLPIGVEAELNANKGDLTLL